MSPPWRDHEESVGSGGKEGGLPGQGSSMCHAEPLGDILVWWGIHVGVYDDRPCRGPRCEEAFGEAKHPAHWSAQEGRLLGQSSQFKKKSISELHVKAREATSSVGRQGASGLSLVGVEGVRSPQLWNGPGDTAVSMLGAGIEMRDTGSLPQVKREGGR